MIFLRVQSRIEEPLQVRGDGYLWAQLPAVKELGGVLVPESGSEGIFVGLTPIDPHSQDITTPIP